MTTPNYTSADLTYAFLLQDILRLNNVVETRNHSCYCNPFLDNVTFDSLPLITVRKTAWKLALTEMEWFMSGDSKCPEKLSKWWTGQLGEDGHYEDGYSHQFRHYSYGLDEQTGYAMGIPLGRFDQIAYILDGLKNHQHSRRLVMTSWNTGEMANITKTNNNPNTPSTCFPSWSTVLTKEGIRTISDLSVGEFIWDGSKYVEVLAITPKGVQDVYCATTRKGNFYSTLDHKVSNGQKLVPLKDAKRLEICTGDRISASNLEPQDIMNGLCLADGTIHHNKILLHIGQNDHDYFESEISHLIYNNIHSNTDPTVYNVETTLTALPKTFERTIPDEYLYGNSFKKAGLLRGLFSGNGSYSANRVSLHQTSEKLIQEVQLMLNSLGISSSVCKTEGRDVTFRNGTYKCKDSYELTVLRQDHDLFFSRIGFIQKYKCQKPLACIRNTTTALIKDLSLYSTEEVFDITVDSKEHLLWCNGFKVSNCHGSLVQFFVVDGTLHIKHYTRSQDVMLGTPHNFVQYWALLAYFAFHANLKVGSLTWVFGDAHIYNELSHLEAAEQIIEFGNDTIKYKPTGFCNNNSPLNPPPKLVYSYSGELDWFGTPRFSADDFTIEGEIPKPTVLTKPKLL